MKIKQIATATLMPATIAGLALSTGTAAHAATHRHAQGKAAQHAHASGRAHQWVTVRRGDTLSGIAAAHHMSWQAIYATPPNTARLADPNVLLVGERLRIPAAPKLRAAQFADKYQARLRQESGSSGPAPSGSAQADPAQTAAQAQPGDSGASLTAGMSSFEQCVAWRESSDTPTDPDGLFGILPATWESLGYSGTAGEASVAQQETAFARLHAEDGTQPWAPYDGC